MTPELKQEWDLTALDFERHPVWIGVHNYDVDEPWYEQSDECTFRPWTGVLPFTEERGFVLAAATFRFCDGSHYPGHVRSVGKDWDKPHSRRTSDGKVIDMGWWSKRHGGTPLSVLALQSPTLFVGNEKVDFRFGKESVRAHKVRKFYALLEKSPTEVFPVDFWSNTGLCTGINSGALNGFISFPLDKPFLIDTGESFLSEAAIC